MLNKILKFISLFCSTLVMLCLLIYQSNSSIIKAKFFKTQHSQEVKETELEYFKRIGKTNKQIAFDRYTTVAVNTILAVPFFTSIISKNPIMYITYAGAVILSTPITAFGKKIFKEARPDDKNDLTSFPSGHSIFAFTSASVLLLCIRREKNKAIFGCISICIAISIAIGRLLANRHWAVDVLAGSAIGCISGTLAFLLVNKINAKIRLFKYNNAIDDDSDI